MARGAGRLACRREMAAAGVGVAGQVSAAGGIYPHSISRLVILCAQEGPIGILPELGDKGVFIPLVTCVKSAGGIGKAGL